MRRDLALVPLLLSTLAAGAPRDLPSLPGGVTRAPLEASLASGQQAISTSPGASKLDPLLARAVRAHGRGALVARLVPETLVPFETGRRGETLVPVLVRTDDPPATRAAIEAAGGTVSTVAGDVLVARLPLARVDGLAGRVEVVSIQASTLSLPKLNASRSDVKADQVQSGGGGLPRPFTGAGVVAGVVDSGLDFKHQDFKTASGSRVISLWDMSGTAGPPAGYSYGRECTKTEMEAGQCPEKDGSGGGGHGTHVTGTVAGNGRSQPGGYIGMAPEADIVFVKGTRAPESDGGFGDTDVIDGCDYIFRKAQALGKPAVVNLSLGGHYGPHDGTSNYERALSNLTGPGRIIVAAAGNEGSDLVHLGYTTSGSDLNSALVTLWDVKTGAAIAIADLWYASGSISVGIVAYQLNGNTLSPVAVSSPIGPGQKLEDFELKSNASGQTLAKITVDASAASDPNNGARRATLLIDSASGTYDIASTYWGLYTFGSGAFDAWMVRGGQFSTSSNGFKPGDNSRSIGIPATSLKVIAVGAYVTKNQWVDVDGTSQQQGFICGSSPATPTIGDLACFSSRGPTRDGRMKPDLAAPGEAIFATLSSDANVSRPNVLQGGSYLKQQGTSMASPHVAGVVALMLQANPTLTYDQVVGTLQQTARRDGVTGDSASNDFGAGRLDALEAVKVYAGSGGSPTFTLGVSGSISVPPGGSGSVTVTSTASGGFSSSVALSASGLPAGATASVTPSSIAGGTGSSTLTVFTTAGTPPGSTTITVSGTGGGLTRTASFELLVSGGTGGSTVVKLLPIVLDVVGIGDARYQSQLFLANRGSTSATVQLSYTAADAFGGQGSGNVSLALAAGQQLVIEDAITYLRQRGLSIPSNPPQGGSLRVTFTGLSSPDVSFAGARTTAPSGSGRSGLAYSATRIEDALTGTSWIYGLRETAADRTNLALVNASASETLSFRVTVFSGAGGGAGFRLNSDITLGPGKWTQVGSILALGGLTQGYAAIEVVSGSGPYYAYAVFNDRETSDGSFVSYEPDVVPKEARTLPVLVETTAFGSELVLSNAYGSPQTVTLTYTESLTPQLGGGGTITETLQAGEQRIIPNAIDYLRMRGVAIGSRGTGSFAGALVASFSMAGQPSDGFVGARTASPPGSGPGHYGLFYAGIGASQAATSEAWVFGLVQNSDVRANLAVVNLGDAGPISFRIDVFDGATGQKAGQTTESTLPSGGWIQFGNVLPTFNVTQGYARVVRTSGSSRIASYGVVVDGAAPGSGRTDDGSYIGFSNR